ncbi:MAG: 50S ribosomal protein L4 [Gammaproteobacteria bacterium]|nr:50S ribosomal protein L4 [Gammaproteobacteria bacterium]
MKLKTVGGAAPVEVSDEVFGREFNETLVHQVVVAHMAGGRAGTRGHKSRADVAGGGAKPFRQKGGGRARAGSIRSPLWRTGGKTFASTNQNYSQKVNKKMRIAAMRAIFSELARQDRLVVVDSLALDAPKTKSLVGKLKGYGIGEALLVTEQFDENLYLSARNLINVEVREAAKVDPVSLVAFPQVVVTAGAIKKIEEMLG